MQLIVSILGLVATAAFATGLGLTLYGLKQSRLLSFVVMIVVGTALSAAANIAGQRLDWQSDQIYLTEVRGVDLPPGSPPPTVRAFELRWEQLIPWSLSGAVVATLVAMALDTAAQARRRRRADPGGRGDD